MDVGAVLDTGYLIVNSRGDYYASNDFLYKTEKGAKQQCDFLNSVAARFPEERLEVKVVKVAVVVTDSLITEEVGQYDE